MKSHKTTLSQVKFYTFSQPFEWRFERWFSGSFRLVGGFHAFARRVIRGRELLDVGFHSSVEDWYSFDDEDDLLFVFDGTCVIFFETAAGIFASVQNCHLRAVVELGAQISTVQFVDRYGSRLRILAFEGEYSSVMLQEQFSVALGTDDDESHRHEEC